jgi:hypothetical protein
MPQAPTQGSSTHKSESTKNWPGRSGLLNWRKRAHRLHQRHWQTRPLFKNDFTRLFTGEGAVLEERW